MFEDKNTDIPAAKTLSCTPKKIVGPKSCMGPEVNDSAPCARGHDACQVRVMRARATDEDHFGAGQESGCPFLLPIHAVDPCCLYWSGEQHALELASQQ